MADYKRMYYKMVSATEKAMEILIEVQRECEEIHINCDDNECEEKNSNSNL